MSSISYQTLSPPNFAALHQGFLRAFSSYPATVQPSADELRLRFKRIGLDYRLSAAAFLGKEVIGFILTGRGGFMGFPTAYNAGTGVHPEYRRQGIAKDLYHYLFPVFKKQGLGQCVLEVIDTNEPAVRFYEKLGFEKTRKLQCYASPVLVSSPHTAAAALTIREVAQPDWLSYEKISSLRPSWQNTPQAIERVGYHETTLEAYWQTSLAGFIIFSPDNGRISQIATAKELQNKGIGTALVLQAQKVSQKRMSILNISDESSATCQFFQHLGFHRPFQQWEMAKSLLY